MSPGPVGGDRLVGDVSDIGSPTTESDSYPSSDNMDIVASRCRRDERSSTTHDRVVDDHVVVNGTGASAKRKSLLVPRRRSSASRLVVSRCHPSASTTLVAFTLLIFVVAAELRVSDAYWW